MKKVEAIIRTEKLEEVKAALEKAGFVGLNTVNVIGRGRQKGITHVGRSGEKVAIDMLPKLKMELVVANEDVEKVVNIITSAARTGSIGDGKIFILPIEEVIRLRTGERGEKAL